MTRKTPSPNLDNRLAQLILICFFFSGFTALIYEIIWMRMIGEVIGAAPFAVSAILFVFMGGMGVGSLIASRRIDDFSAARLIRTYGSLELLIGLYAFFVPIFLLLFKVIYEILYNAFFESPLVYNLFIFLGALILLGLPTLCMGATLPILCKFYVARLSHLGTHTGRLYGLNTIGGAAGSIICGFWMLQAFGVWASLLMTIAVNCIIGVLCISMAPSSPEPSSPKQRSKKQPPDPPHQADPTQESPPKWILSGALILFFVSGASAMAYEVIWTKLLGLLVGPTTYSFTIVLATFIVGLALGNMIFGWLADRVKNTILLLVVTQIAAAFLALAASQIMGNSQLFFAKLIYTFKEQFTALSLAKAMALAALMMPPTLFLGATFPLVAKIYSHSLPHVGRSIGVAYSVNTLGAVLGSICAGLILIPLVGKENGLKIIVGMQLISAVVIGILTLARQKAMVIKLTGFTAAAIVGLYFCTTYPTWNRLLLAKGKYHRFEEISFSQDILAGAGWLESLFKGAEILNPLERGKLIYYGDGIGGFTTVLKYPGPFDNVEYSLANSGKMDASSRSDMYTQTALAHFPMLFAENPSTVMVLGLASGITAGEVLHYPIKQLDVIDINDRVEAASRFFDPWNNNVLDDPRTRLIFQDGRAHLALTDTQYDVIISEPSNPWMAGMATLFTKDFFQLTKERLKENGIYVQWLHCYQMDWSTFTLIGRTFADVFPNNLMVSTSPEGLGRDYLLVGLNSEKGLNWKNAHKAIAHLQQSNNIAMAVPELYARQIISEDLKVLFGKGPINTDDMPLLEFAAPKLMYAGQKDSGAILTYLASYPGLSDSTKALARRIKQDTNAALDFIAYALSIYSPFKKMIDADRLTPQQKSRYYDLMKSYGRSNAIDFSIVDEDLAPILRKTQIEALESQIDQFEFKAPSYSYLAGLYDDQGMQKEAVSFLKKSLEIDPDDAGNHNNLGYMLDQKGQTEQAMRHYKEAIRLNPFSLISLGNLAFLNMQHDHPDEAIDYFERILQIHPDQVEALYYIGTLYQKKNDPGQAVVYFKRALEIDPGFSEANTALARAKAQLNRR